jgi:hypothetical protein
LLLSFTYWFCAQALLQVKIKLAMLKQTPDPFQSSIEAKLDILIGQLTDIKGQLDRLEARQQALGSAFGGQTSQLGEHQSQSHITPSEHLSPTVQPQADNR